MVCSICIVRRLFLSGSCSAVTRQSNSQMTTSMTYSQMRSALLRVGKPISAARHLSDRKDSESVGTPLPTAATDKDSIPSSTLPRRVLKRVNEHLPSQKIARVAVTESPDSDRSLAQDRLAPVAQTLKSLVQDASSFPDISDLPEFPSDAARYQTWYRDQSRKAKRPAVDPRTTTIILFPGQGSQTVGMGEQLLEYDGVPEMYETASRILGYDLLDICLNGPKAKLDKTVYCQPAILVTSLAAVEKLKALYPEAVNTCVGTAGFSIGEFAAMVFSGAMSFEDAVAVVKVRGEAMQAASEASPGGMMTAFCGPDTRLRFACKAARDFCQAKLGMERPVCTIANFLYPECKVIAGHNQALEFIEQHRADFGIRRLKRLPVSGAFHTELMGPARAALKRALQSVTLSAPSIPVYSNVSAASHSQPPVLLQQLAAQLTRPVRWEQTMHVLLSRAQGTDFPSTFELGPGRQLGAILKLVNGKAFESYHSIDV